MQIISIIYQITINVYNIYQINNIRINITPHLPINIPTNMSNNIPIITKTIIREQSQKQCPKKNEF